MLSIDRFEGDFAVCIDDFGKIINVKISEIPKKAKEGTILIFSNGKYLIDENETIKRKKEIINLQNSLWE